PKGIVSTRKSGAGVGRVVIAVWPSKRARRCTIRSDREDLRSGFEERGSERLGLGRHLEVHAMSGADLHPLEPREDVLAPIGGADRLDERRLVAAALRLD